MKQIILARYGEIHLKGGNRDHFIRALLNNLRKRLKGIATASVQGTRIEINKYTDERSVVDIVSATFGVVSLSIVAVVELTPESIFDYLKTQKINGRFKVNVNRANKNFPIKTMDFAPICGGIILDNNPNAIVDVNNPETTISIDIREQTYIYDNVISGVGGLPVGVSGRALVLLSGGIDSPVASYLAAKRGLGVDFIHFATPPYTSDLSIEKIKTLATKLETFTDKSRLFVVPFTEISKAIKKNCDPSYTITIMRRFMIRIAEHVGRKTGASCIITGENLAQVASQTIEGIASNNFCVTCLPILRPLITFDKSEIITMAKKIGTYETSIQPHEDCCTVFVPERPVIKPNIKKAIDEESKLDIEKLIIAAVDGVI
ncbi:MAG: tRNA 4-thiouridine(8) synthase ThiI [Firmicutes bacterium]|nr:tRNA 4-thiouridine(8) synthase ThiI [Bacillota bacterium]